MTKIKKDINFKGLNSLLKEISKHYKVQVGLLADKGGAESVQDNDGNVNNDMDYAGLGALMECGATIKVTDKMRKYLASQGLYLKNTTTEIHIPARSFLQMPLQEKSKEITKKTKQGYSVQEIDYAIKQNANMIYNFALVLGANCLEAIQEAFNTKGFGEWKENHPFTVKQKKSSSPLIDTGTLRQKVSFEVLEQ